MFERFTEKAIKVIMLAQEEARRLGHNFVDTNFILLGLIGEGTGIAAKTLKSMGINLKDARKEVERDIGRGDGSVEVEIPLTPKCKRQLELAWDEARQLGHNFIGTEHLLLALTRLEESAGSKVLQSFGLETVKVRSHVIRSIGEADAGKLATSPTTTRRIDSDEIEHEVNKTLFEAVVSALPVDAQPIVLNLRQVICDKEKMRGYSWSTGEAAALWEREIELLKKLSEQMALSPEARKLTVELRQIRCEKEEAIKAHEFDKAAALREKETELSEKLRELKEQAAEGADRKPNGMD